MDVHVDTEEDVMYIPANGQRWFYRLSQDHDGDWYWQLLLDDHAQPVGQRAGPFRDRGRALYSGEQWIDAHQDRRGGEN